MRKFCMCKQNSFFENTERNILPFQKIYINKVLTKVRPKYSV